jgi:hypothetical protein
MKGAGVVTDRQLTKARAALTEGRLLVDYVNGSTVRARCRSSTGYGWYPLGFDPERGWWCSCPARRSCSHLLALFLVVRRPTRPDEPVCEPVSRLESRSGTPVLASVHRESEES